MCAIGVTGWGLRKCTQLAKAPPIANTATTMTSGVFFDSFRKSIDVNLSDFTSEKDLFTFKPASELNVKRNLRADYVGLNVAA